jgi:hypothetical protein
MPDILNLYSTIENAIEEFGPATEAHHDDRVKLVMLVAKTAFHGDETLTLIREAMDPFIEMTSDGTEGELA